MLDTATLENASPELIQVIEFEEIPQDMHDMLINMHLASHDAVLEAWQTLPPSAQNILDNFEQFHALVTVSQGFTGAQFMQEFESSPATQQMSEEQKETNRITLLNEALFACMKDMLKQLKKARRDPILKKDFNQVFTKKK